MVADLKEVVVIAADAAGGKAVGGKRGGRRIGRALRQQAPLHFRRERHITPQFFLLGHAAGQTSVFHHERELFGAIAEEAQFEPVVLRTREWRTKQQEAEYFRFGSQRNGYASFCFCNGLYFSDVLWLVFAGPARPGVEIARGNGQRQAVKAQTVG